MSLFLAANKQSLARDPINWDRLCGRLKAWERDNCPEGALIIPSTVDALFRERALPATPGRTRTSMRRRTEVAAFRFYNGVQTDDQRPSRSNRREPSDVATLVDRCNKWPRAMGFLGLLPNQFRLLLKTYLPDHRVVATEISQLIFWEGYRVWNRRCRLVRDFKQGFAARVKDGTACKNPFHFLTRVTDLGSGKVTKCPCYRVQRAPQITCDLRALVRSHRLPSRTLEKAITPKVKRVRGSERGRARSIENYFKHTKRKDG